MSGVLTSLSGRAAKVGREGDRAAGDVLDRFSWTLRGMPEGEPSLVRDGVVGKREKAGLLVGCGDVALRDFA